MIGNGNIYAVPRTDRLNKFSEDAERINVEVLASCKSIQMISVGGLDVDTLMEQMELIFKICNKLKELHWHQAKHVSIVLSKFKFLKVLSIPFTFNFTPKDFSRLIICDSLNRLDLRGSFNIQEGVMG